MSSADSAAADTSLVASIVPLVPAWRVDKTFDYAVPRDLSDKVHVGSLVRIPFGHRKVRGIVTSLEARDAEGLEEVISPVFDVSLIPGPLIELYEWIADRYCALRARTFSRAVPPRIRIKPGARPELEAGPEPKRILGYTNGERLVADIESRRAGTWVLRTTPGEDRPAMIAELIGAAHRAGGAALVTVPEVAYGSEVLDRLKQSFGDVARVDSAQDDPARSKAWLALAHGHPLGGGGRSAILAPAPDLALIVVDEEHHISYKEDRSPRYDAVRVARERARAQRAVCVLISPTPSLESGAPAVRGAIGYAFPDRTTERATRPIVETVEPPTDRSLAPVLHDRIRETLRAGGKVGLLVPRRGFARALWCSDCRRSLRCPRCEAGLAFDRTPRRVRCPRCTFTSTPPDTCPSCGSSEFRYLGAGSERLEEQIDKSFPDARVARMDPDLLAAGNRPPSDVDIYVTTWIGTKSALRPDVSLVGILDFDVMVRRADFRAAEHAYHALIEMAEWAGPANGGGRLLIQTDDPRHHAVQALMRADYGYWLEHELPLRQELDYPPFAELVKVTARGPRSAQLIEAASERCRTAGARVLGPIRVPRYEGGKAREPDIDLQILVKCPDAGPIAAALRDILPDVPAGSRLTVDVDPR
jgi:primosomal protein N' (replication factor Y) (superfamily II helicase)